MRWLIVAALAGIGFLVVSDYAGPPAGGVSTIQATSAEGDGLPVAGALAGAVGEWSDRTDEPDGHDTTDDHQSTVGEWCQMSVGDTDGDGYAEKVPCDPETRVAAERALAGLHGGGDDRAVVAP